MEWYQVAVLLLLIFSGPLLGLGILRQFFIKGKPQKKDGEEKDPRMLRNIGIVTVILLLFWWFLWDPVMAIFTEVTRTLNELGITWSTVILITIIAGLFVASRELKKKSDKSKFAAIPLLAVAFVLSILVIDRQYEAWELKDAAFAADFSSGECLTQVEEIEMGQPFLFNQAHGCPTILRISAKTANELRVLSGGSTKIELVAKDVDYTHAVDRGEFFEWADHIIVDPDVTYVEWKLEPVTEGFADYGISTIELVPFPAGHSHRAALTAVESDISTIEAVWK